MGDVDDAGSDHEYNYEQAIEAMEKEEAAAREARDRKEGDGMPSLCRSSFVCVHNQCLMRCFAHRDAPPFVIVHRGGHIFSF
jgi:hypothetical protein